MYEDAGVSPNMYCVKTPFVRPNLDDHPQVHTYMFFPAASWFSSHVLNYFDPFGNIKLGCIEVTANWV